MFIDSGAISIIRQQTTYSIINDPYKGMLFKNPMVVLIMAIQHQQSEFSLPFCRIGALLLGSSTHGKATMQTILPLDKITMRVS
jgi:carboxyl-terminal processing protease